MAKIKEVIKQAFDGLHPRDTFNLITFSGDEHILFPKPVPATPENVAVAWKFMQSREGRGGTEMMKAIRASLDPSDEQDHLRVVCFMTDGEVGNDMEILAEIQRHKNARVFAFGIGNSVNRFLLDGMSRYGRGETQFVTLTEDGSAAAKKFHERVRTPLLTDIQIDWNGLEVSAVSPAQIPDLFSAKPLVISGRYSKPGKRTIQLKGKVAGRNFSREIEVDLKANEPKHDVLATLWARRRIEELTAKDFRGIQYGRPNDEVKQQITDLGLEFRLMTQFTSFVAVEQKIVNENGQSRRVDVPVEMPEGVSYEGVYGEERREMAKRASMPLQNYAIGSGRASMSVQMPMTVRPAAPAPPVKTAEAESDAVRDRRQNGKIHASLLTLPSGTHSMVQIWLNHAGGDVLAKLKAAGLKIDKVEGNLVTGKVDVANLQRLAAIAEVRSIGPSPKTL
jgi:Ca-activated chloride channel family protein